jgi:hypothetical protein
MEVKIAKDRAPDAIAAEIIKTVESFLVSFEQTMRAQSSNLNAPFFTNFLTIADRLNNQCCVNLAGRLLEHSQQPDVRASSETTLVRLIRSRCFENLDVILENYVGYVEQLSTDLRHTVQALSDSRLRNCLTGTEMSSVEKAKKFKLPTAAKESAIVHMFEYFTSLQSTLAELLDYGCRKLGESSGDTEQSGLLALMDAELESPFANVLAQFENHTVIKRKRWEQQHASEASTLNTIVAASNSKSEQRRSLTGSLTLSILFAVPVCFLWSTGTTNLYVVGAIGVSALLALICFLRTITAIAKYY